MLNIVYPLFLAFSLVGVVWLSFNKIGAGDSYFTLSLLGLIFLTVTVVWKFIGKVDFAFEIPINKTNSKAILVFILGFLFLFGIFGISKITQSFTSVEYNPYIMAPLSAFGSLSVTEQSFQSLKTATSPFWIFFTNVITAGVIEETVFGFICTMFFALLAFGVLKMVGWDFGPFFNNNIAFLIGVVGSMIIFSVFHSFNGTYLNADGSWNISLFLFAAFFRGIMNILMFKLANLGLMFTLGVHFANNILYLISLPGNGGLVVDALLTFPGGIILSFIFLLLIFVAFKDFNKVVFEEGELLIKDSYTWE